MGRWRYAFLFALIGLTASCRGNPFAPPESSIEGFNLYATDFSAQDDGGMKAALLEVINGSKATLHCAFSALTLSDVSSAIIARSQAGVKVKVAFDADVRDSDTGSLALQASGAFVIVATPGETTQGQLLYGNNGTGVMRHNFCLADERYVWMSTAAPDDTQMRLTPNIAIKVGSPQFGLARDFLRESSMFSQLLFGGGKAKTDYTTKFAALDQVIAAYWGPQESPMDVLGTELSEATRTVDFYSTAFQATNTSSTKSYLDVPTVLKALETAKGVTIRKYFSSQALFDSASKAYTLTNPSQYVNNNVRVGANIFVVDRNLSSTRTYIYTGALRSQGNSSDDSVLLELRGPRVAQLVAAYLDRIGAVAVPVSNSGDTAAAGQVVISEIMWMGTYNNATVGDGADEFIEFYNTTSSAINLSGWQFACTTDGTNNNSAISLPPGALIAPNGYFVVASKNTGAFAGSANHFDSKVGITNSSRECRLGNGKTAATVYGIANFGDVIDTIGNNTNGFDTGTWGRGVNESSPNFVRRSMERANFSSPANMNSYWRTNAYTIAQNQQVSFEYINQTYASPGQPYSTFNVLEVRSAGKVAVLVQFNEAPTAGGGATGAENIANYSLPGLTITGAALAGATTVILATSPQTLGANYTLTISNITAAQAGISLSASSGIFAGGGPTLVSATPINSTTVDLNFDYDLDPTTVNGLPGRFSLNSGGSVLSSTLILTTPHANKRVRITTTAQSANSNYLVTVDSNVRDVLGVAVVSPFHQAGFYGFSTTFGIIEEATAGMEGLNAIYWSNSGSATLSNNTAEFNSGVSSITWSSLTTSCTSGRTFRTLAYYPVTPGGSYNASMYLKSGIVSGGGTVGGRLRIFWYQNNIGTPSTTANTLGAAATNLTNSSPWTLHNAGGFTAPSDAFYMRLQIHACYTASAISTDQLYFDQAYFGP